MPAKLPSVIRQHVLRLSVTWRGINTRKTSEIRKIIKDTIHCRKEILKRKLHFILECKDCKVKQLTPTPEPVSDESLRLHADKIANELGFNALKNGI